MYKTLISVLLICCAAFVRSDSIYEKCGNQLQCVEEEMVQYIDRMDVQPTVPIFGDFLILQKTKDEAPRAAEGLLDRCLRFITNHELTIKMPSSSARSLVEDGRSRKLKKIILPLLLLLKLKAAIVIPAVLSVIALVAFKGLGASLIALTIAGATGLKSLLEGHHGSKLTYEVVPQIAPHWSRAGVDALAAQGYHTIA